MPAETLGRPKRPARRHDVAVTPRPNGARLRTPAILGLGTALPAQVVTNAEIAERLGTDEAWILKRTGIRERRRAAAGERLTDLAVRAGEAALADAQIAPDAVDLVLLATLTPDEICPSGAPLIAYELGCANAGAIDVGAACTGWLSALQLAAGQVEAGRARTVLVIGAEKLSRIVDPDDKRTAALFGDGAGAAVVGQGAGAIGPVVLHADGSLAPALVATYADPFLRMDGHETFKAAVASLTEATQEACAAADLRLSDIDCFVYHQANGRIISAVAQRLDLPKARVLDYVARTGNTSAASLPLALAFARADGRLRPGDRVLVAAVGAGFTWGAGTLTWEETRTHD
jgi:3-oxoacyl-[acyl-carrier-protein] synthase-3